MGPRLPIEFQILGYAPKKWRPEDILGRMSGIIMTSNWQREIARARLVAEVGLEEARRLAPTDPPRAWGPDPALDLSKITTEITLVDGVNTGSPSATRCTPLTTSAAVASLFNM